MRQDIIERERQIRRLHQSIEKYQQSPNSKKAIQKAHKQLLEAIQYKYSHSTMNMTYKFPFNSSDDEEQPQLIQKTEIVHLNQIQQPSPTDLSIAEQAESKPVYISQKTILSKQKYSTLNKNSSHIKSRLKIKIGKKKYIETCSSIEKLKRFKTDYTPTNYSINTNVVKSYKKEVFNHSISQSSDLNKNDKQNTDSTSHKNFNSSITESGGTCFKKKVKQIYHLKTKKDSQNRHISPVSSHSTLHNQYTPLNTYKKSNNCEKENISLILHENAKEKEREKIQLRKKGNTSLKFAMVLRAQKAKNLDQSMTENLKKKGTSHRSFDNLKSIKLGNSSKQKQNLTLKQR